MMHTDDVGKAQQGPCLWRSSLSHEKLLHASNQINVRALKTKNKDKSFQVTRDKHPETQSDNKTPAWQTHLCYQRETNREMAWSQLADNRATHRQTACDCLSSLSCPQRGVGVYFSVSKVIWWWMIKITTQEENKLWALGRWVWDYPDLDLTRRSVL